MRRVSADCAAVPVMLGLYVHIPFCSSICNYCNFNRGLFDAGLKTRYVAALRQEIARAGARQPRPPTPSSSAAARRRCSSPTRSRPSSRASATRSIWRAGRRGHARDQSGNRRSRRSWNVSAPPVSTASVSVSSRSTTRNCGGSGGCTGGSGAGGGRRGADRGLRQRQPGSDDVAARDRAWTRGSPTSTR